MPLFLQRLLRLRPAPAGAPLPLASSNASSHLHPAWVVVLISTWLATACNVPLWREVAQLPGQGSLRGWGFALAFAVIVAAGNAALLSLLAWRWTLKPAAALLVVMAAFGAYFMLAYGIAIDASMLVNVLQTDVREAGDLLSWRMLATVGALAVPPLLWLHRRPVRRLGALRHAAHNGLLLLGSVVVIVVCLLLVFQDFASTMRNHTRLRYLINPLNSVYALGNIATKPLRLDTSKLLPVGRDAQLGASYAGQSKPPLLVLVLGETGRSGNFGINGYERDTTPRLSARSDLISARNAWSCGTSTAASVPCMFSHLGRTGYEARSANFESLIDVLRRPRDYRIRLAGTGLYGVYGREITGRRLGEVYAPPATDYWRGELDRVVLERRPSVGVHNLAWRGASHLSILWLRLPLASNGRDVDMIMGFDAVVGLNQIATGIRAA